MCMLWTALPLGLIISLQVFSLLLLAVRAQAGLKGIGCFGSFSLNISSSLNSPSLSMQPVCFFPSDQHRCRTEHLVEGSCMCPFWISERCTFLCSQKLPTGTCKEPHVSLMSLDLYWETSYHYCYLQKDTAFSGALLQKK